MGVGVSLRRRAVSAVILAVALCATPALPAAKARAKARPKVTAAPVLTVESPAQGVIARPGSRVRVKMHLDPSVTASRVSLLIGTWEELISYVDEMPPYEFVLPVEQTWSGPLRVMYSAQSARGKVLASGELLVNVVPSEPPVSIAVTDPVRMVAAPAGNQPAPHINVRGTYADGTVRDIGRADLGTTFQSSEPRVVAVDGEGFLTAGVSGRAVVTVRNGELSQRVPVEVHPRSGALLPTKTVNLAAPLAP